MNLLDRIRLQKDREGWEGEIGNANQDFVTIVAPPGPAEEIRAGFAAVLPDENEPPLIWEVQDDRHRC